MKNSTLFSVMTLLLFCSFSWAQAPQMGSATNQSNQSTVVLIEPINSVNQTAVAQNQQTTNQIQTSDVVYTDYNSVSRGAFWKDRPEAKAVFMGWDISSYNIQAGTLNQDYFCKFAKGEASSTNINYIRLPAGTKVYKNLSTGNWHVAECGNTCVYLKPCEQVRTETVYVDRTVPVEKVVYRDRIVQVPVQQQTVYTQQPVTPTQQTVYTQQPVTPTQTVVKDRFWNGFAIGTGVGLLAGGVGGYFLGKNNTAPQYVNVNSGFPVPTTGGTVGGSNTGGDVLGGSGGGVGGSNNFPTLVTNNLGLWNTGN